MSNPLLSISAITLFTESLSASKTFYTTVLGATVLFQDAESCAVQLNNNLILNLLTAEAAQDLVRPATVAPPDAGKRFQLSIWVADLDAAIDELKGKGVVFSTGPETKPWGMRVVTFEDPAGHSWEVAQKVG